MKPETDELQHTAELRRTAELFKVLSAPSRLQLLLILAETPSTVTDLVQATGLSQPLVSQHLRTLRQSLLVVAQRSGREQLYSISDQHVSHIVRDAITHINEREESA